MTMAMWAVPHIDPWLDVLVASLSSNRAQLPSLAARVSKAHWWRLPPWARAPVDSQALGQHDGLWLAAVDVFRDGPVNGPTPPRELAEQIAVAGARYGRPEDEVAAWLRDTLGILRTESTIQLDDWRDSPVGMAIQMVLTRPEPTTFKTWSRDLPGLPPAVWWSAATLCGLYHGYRRLDTRFRGSAEQREFLSVHAWRTCATECKEVRWPHLDMGELKWRREKDGFALFRGKKNIAHKRNQARGKWYAAGLRCDGSTGRSPSACERSGMVMSRKTLKLPPGRLRVSGPGNVKVLDRALDIQGTVEIDCGRILSSRTCSMSIPSAITLWWRLEGSRSHQLRKPAHIDRTTSGYPWLGVYTRFPERDRGAGSRSEYRSMRLERGTETSRSALRMEIRLQSSPSQLGHATWPIARMGRSHRTETRSKGASIRRPGSGDRQRIYR